MYQKKMTNEQILVLNDAGGAVMDISYDVTATLRAQTHGHPPVVLVYESHNIDCRYRDMGDVCETITQYYGTGGCNTPIVLEKYENLHSD